MNFFNTWGMGAPWALGLFLILPLLWYILNNLPPRPKRQVFPPIRLLLDLRQGERMRRKSMPWWLKVLRFSLISLFILALSQPYQKSNNTALDLSAPVIIMIGNDWSLAPHWEQQKQSVQMLLNQLPTDHKSILIYGLNDAEPHTSWQTIPQARAQLDRLAPRAWPLIYPDEKAPIWDFIKSAPKNTQIIWVDTALALPDKDAFRERLSNSASVFLQTVPTVPLSTLQDVKRTPNGFSIRLLSTAPIDGTNEVPLLLLNEQQQIIAKERVPIQDSDHSEMDLPYDLANQTYSLQIEGQRHAGAVYILNERWRGRRVGILQNANGAQINLLSPNHYLEKALSPYAEIVTGSFEELMAQNIDLILTSEVSQLSPENQTLLERWIARGGSFIAFGSEGLAPTPQDKITDILPLPLLSRTRTLGGAMNWQERDLTLHFTDRSPFKGLVQSDPLKLTRQTLSTPRPDLENRIWARLSDGTPFISAKQIDKGQSIFFHVAPTPDWSALPLSGLFENIMIRLIALSQGQEIQASDQPLAAYLLMDGFGNLSAPDQAAHYTPQHPVSANQPAGLYGTRTAYRAANLGPHIGDLIPDQKTATMFPQLSQDMAQIHSWTPVLFAGAILLFFADWLAVIWLTHQQGRRIPVSALFFVALFIANETAAQAPEVQAFLQAANETRFAYIQTGNRAVDQDSDKGLRGLGFILKRRTAVELASPVAVNPHTSELNLYPFLYWPLSADQEPPNPTAAENLKRYMANGGFILIDNFTQNRPLLRRVLSPLNLPTLQQVGKDHVLNRSFYLISRYPGRYDREGLWLEAQSDQTRDGVSGVAIGENGWAQAWAVDDGLRPLYPVTPGGEAQRETAYRFGINLAMYVLSGNYKADQVHLPTIMERLGL